MQRNPLIANVFYLCGKIEKDGCVRRSLGEVGGRGTLDMIKDSTAVKNPLPKYEEIGGTFSITLPFQQSIRGVLLEKIIVKQPKLTKRQQQILNLLKVEPLTRQELIAKMDVPLTDRVMQLEFAKLKDMKLITSEGKANTTIWFVVTH